MIHTNPARPYALVGKKGSNLRSPPYESHPRARIGAIRRSWAGQNPLLLCTYDGSHARRSRQVGFTQDGIIAAHFGIPPA